MVLDYNNDGVINSDDFMAFIMDYIMRLDYNGDGNLDINDFKDLKASLFQNATQIKSNLYDDAVKHMRRG